MRISHVNLAGCLLVGTALAGPISYTSFSGTIINFDTLAGSSSVGSGEILANQYVGQGVTFSVPNFNAYANNGPLATGSSLTSLPNVIWVNQGGGADGSLAQGMDISFSTPQSAVGLYFAISASSTATLAVYDGATLIESVTSGLAPGNYALEGYLALSDPNITEAVVYSTNSGGQNWNFAVDNLKFNGGVVPEPASMLLFATGLGLVAVARRRFSPKK
jgi:hypothetical protein